VSLVEPRFFETMRIALRRGRTFDGGEYNANGRPVAMVNEAFAKKYFPGEDAVGHHMRSGLGAGDPPPMREIVGVVADVKRGKLTEDAIPEYYIPLAQAAVAPPSVVLRVSGDPANYEEMVRATVAQMDAALPVYRMRPYSDDLMRTAAQQRFQAALTGGFAAIALLLSAVGLYGLLTYLVAQRTPELGVRMALGAERGDVLKLILGRGMALAGGGLLIGLAAAMLLTRFLHGMLFGVGVLDPATYATVSALLIVVSLAASLAPAYRASRVDPVKALRGD